MTTAEKAKAERLQRTYKQTLEEHNAKRTEQKNACAICRRPFSQYQAYQDHDHECCSRHRKDSLNRFCGKCNRGLLCFICNKKYVPVIERMLKDGVDPARVAQYVNGWHTDIRLKGGYAGKEKGKPQRKQTGIRRSSKRNATTGATVVVSKSRRQSGDKRGRFTESRKTKSCRVLG